MAAGSASRRGPPRRRRADRYKLRARLEGELGDILDDAGIELPGDLELPKGLQDGGGKVEDEVKKGAKDLLDGVLGGSEKKKGDG